MDINLMKLLLTWSSKLGVGTTILVFIVVGLLSYGPQLLETYNSQQLIGAADTQVSVLQKLYYYNDHTLDRFRSILSQHDVGNKNENKLLVYSAQGVVKEGIIIATNEMNRMPYCMPLVGDYIREQLESTSLNTEVVEIIGRPDLNNKDRFAFTEQVLRSYQRRSVDLLNKEIKETASCVQ